MSNAACPDLLNSVNESLTMINSYIDTLSGGSYDSFSSSMSSLFSSFLSTGSFDIDSVMSEIDSAVSVSLGSIYDSIQNWTGSCLDSIMDPIINGINDIMSFGESLIGDLTGVLTDAVSSLMSGLFSFTGISEAFDSMGISSTVAALDQMLSCLASADCLPIGEIDKMIDKVTSFTSSYGLTSSGNFDLNSWLQNTVENIKNIPQNMVDKFTNTITNLKESFTSWTSGLQDKLSSLFGGNITNGINGLATGGIGGITGGITEVTDFFGSGTSSTKGKNATPIKSGKCDCWDKTKQTSKTIAASFST